MRLLHGIQNHPLVSLVVVAVGFGTWLVCNAISESSPSPPTGAEIVHSQLARPLPPMPPMGVIDRTPAPPRPGVITQDMVTRLQPGMTRVDVEGLIGPPPAAMVRPVTNVDGRFTYRADYLANLEPPPVPPPGVPIPQPPARSVIGLEFDASRPGHPLVKVHIPDTKS